MESIYSESLAKDGHYYWYTSFEDNGIYRTDIRTGETECIDRFSEESQRNMLYGSVVFFDNKLVAIPRFAKKIGIYNIAEKSIQYISFKLPEGRNWRGGCFAAHAVFRNYIYMLGVRYPIILRLNMETYEVSYYGEWYTEVEPYIRPQESPIFFFTRDIYVEGSKFYAPLSCAGFVLCFDMEVGEASLIQVGNEKSGLETLCSDGSDFWLTSSKDKKVIRWNHKSGAIKESWEFPTCLSLSNMRFYKSFCCNNEIFLVPVRDNKIIRINPAVGTMSELQISAQGDLNKSFVNRQYAEPVNEHTIRMINRVEKCWHELNLQTGQTLHYRYSCDFPEAFSLQSDSDKEWFLKQGGIFCEGYQRRYLKRFLEYTQNVPDEMKRFLLTHAAGGDNKDETCGMSILQAIKRELI